MGIFSGLPGFPSLNLDMRPDWKTKTIITTCEICQRLELRRSVISFPQTFTCLKSTIEKIEKFVILFKLNDVSLYC